MTVALAAPTGALAKPAAGARDWSRMVQATPQGGFRMGNPAAPVKLIEYGSLTCPHCRAFDEEGATPLIATYVKSGKVSYEYRSYVRDALDMAAALIARCGGAKSFFPIARSLYDNQPTWTGKVENAPSDTIDRLRSLPKEKIFIETARLAGLQAYANAKGLPASQTARCLTDKAAIDRLAAMTAKAKQDYPTFAGTPSFVINGKLVENVYGWEALQPALKAATGR
jgi:protein-disulfide isomerase